MSKLIAVVAAAAVIVAVASAPTIAHTEAELERWLNGWSRQVIAQGLDTSRLASYTDMASRHPAYFGRLVPHSHARKIRAYARGVEQWRPLVAKYFPAGQVDRALRVMACESGGNPRAKNPRSSARGLFQHLDRYWAQRSRAAGFPGASIFDPEANVATAAWLLRTAGWRSWVCR